MIFASFSVHFVNGKSPVESDSDTYTNSVKVRNYGHLSSRHILWTTQVAAQQEKKTSVCTPNFFGALQQESKLGHHPTDPHTPL